MDDIDHVLCALRLEIGTLCCLDGDVLTGSALPVAEDMQMVCLLQGACAYRAPDGGWCEVMAGDLLIARCGTPLQLGWSARAVPVRDVDRRPRDAFRALHIAGVLTLAGDARHPLLRALPPIWSGRAASAPDPAGGLAPGSVVQHLLVDAPDVDLLLVTRVLEALTVRAIRARCGSLDARQGPLRAWSDPEIGRAIAAIHELPAHNWSLQRLADTAGLSRSGFCRRFSELVGMSAIRYLTAWRMQIALDRLNAGQCDLERLARDVGYRCPTAFQKAFKRVHGRTPAQAAST